MSYKSIYEKLRKYNRAKYRQLEICLIIAIVFVTSFSIILFGPIVQQTFPEGGDSRKQIYMIYVVTLIGCWIFTVYSLALFFKYKSREIGIQLALGARKKLVAKMLAKEIRKVLSKCILIGIVSGLGVSVVIELIFGKAFSRKIDWKYLIDKSGIIVVVLFVLMIIITIIYQSRKYTKKADVLDLIYEQQKSETVKEIGMLYGVFSLFFIILGMFLGYVVPILVAYTKGTNMPPFWGATYLISVLGLYMSIVYVVMGHSKNRKKDKYYKYLLSYNMMRFQGKQTVKNMCVVTLMLIAGMFAFFYVPQLRSGVNVYEKSEYDVSIPMQKKLHLIKEKELEGASDKYDIEIVNYHELDFVELVGSGIERNWNKDNQLVEEYQERYKCYEFISESQFENAMSNDVEVEKGTYLLITSPEANESFWEKNSDLDCVTNLINNTKLNLSYGGTIESVSLLRNGVKRFILNDEDFNEITKGITDDYQITQILFSLEGKDKNQYKFSEALYETLLNRTPDEYAVSSSYDPYQEYITTTMGKEYNNYETLELSIENKDLINYWKYYPIIKPIINTEYMQSTVVYFIIFLYAGFICMISVGMVEFTRVKILAINNKKFFEIIDKLGASKRYLNKCLKEQLKKIFVLPTALSSVVIIAFTIVILRGNDNKFSMLDAQILGMDLLIVMLVVIMQYCIYKCALRRAQEMLNINKF
jgi:putative ABC transport system permease protein